jgi:hypothetical protein
VELIGMDLLDVQVISHRLSQPTVARVILMPGAYHTRAQFLEHGFDRAVRAHALPIELILIDPQRSHLTDRRWLQQLNECVIEPARADPGARLWLGGISLGGFMALRFAAQYPRSLDGLCLLAPYLGSRLVAAELAAHADLQQWQPGPLDDDDDERRIWRYATALEANMTPTRIFLGLGSEDRFGDTQRLLARALPPMHTRLCSLPGGHDWAVWGALWDQFLGQEMSTEAR